MPTFTLDPDLFKNGLAYELYDRDTPRFRRNQERLDCRILADKVVQAWPPFMPRPSTRRQLQKIAALAIVKGDKYRPEDIAEIVAPVWVG